MANWKQLQEKDPKKMWENVKNAVKQGDPQALPPVPTQPGMGMTVSPSYNPDAETEAQIADQQSANMQQAQQDPALAAKMQAMNEMIRRANEQKMSQMGAVPSIAEQIRRRNQMSQE